MKRVLLSFLCLPLWAAKPVALTITTASLPPGIQDTAYTGVLSAKGGRPPYSWRAGGLPAGIVVSGSSLSGTPSSPGVLYVTLTVRDQMSKTNSATLPLMVAAKPLPTTISDDEFVGPFPSWTNLKATYGAKGDGLADDTAAINKALAEVGTAGHNHNVWVDCGTYRVTGLVIPPKEGISFIASDPACVKLLLATGSAGPLIRVNGVDYSRLSRFALDAGGNTNAIILDQSGSPGGFFDTGNEYADDVFQNAGIGIRCGALYNGCSEVSIIRDHFSNISQNCVLVGNYNALDIWVRYSVFDHCGIGVGNNPGAGNFHVYNSIFRASVNYDIDIGNTAPFSFRDNFHTGAPLAIHGAFTSNAAPMTIAGNTFLSNKGSNGSAASIDIVNQGPVLLLDNFLLPETGSTTRAMFGLNNVLAVGNTVAAGFTPVSSNGPSLELDTQIVDRSLISVTEPILPGVQPRLNRTVFEVSGTDATAIQMAINSAAALNGSRPIVHLPEGQYSIGVQVLIPANSDLQLVGDGPFATFLNWTGTGGCVISIAGPSHATLRDFRVNANLQADGICARGIDQPGSRVFMHGVQMGADGQASNSNLFFDGLDYTVVEAEDTTHAATLGTGVKVVGGPLAQSGSPRTGKLNIYSGTAAGETTPYSVTGGGTLLVRDLWNESQGPAFLNASGRANVTLDGAWANLNGNVGQSTPAISISDLIGKVSILASEPQDRVVISGDNSQGQVLESVGMQSCPVTSPYFVNNSTGGTVGLFMNRECTTTVPGTGTIATADIGSADPAFLRSMLADTRAAHQAPLTTLPANVTDLRLYRVSVNRGINGIHLSR